MARYHPGGDAGEDYPTDGLIGHPDGKWGRGTIGKAKGESGIGKAGEEGGKEERDSKSSVNAVPISGGRGTESEPPVGGDALEGEGEGQGEQKDRDANTDGPKRHIFKLF